MDWYNPIDVIALVVAVIIIVKSSALFFIKPKHWTSMAKRVKRSANWLMGVYALIALIVGYFIFSVDGMRVEYIAAVMLFSSMLLNMVLMMYPESTALMIEEAKNKHYLPIVVLLLAFAVWILIDLFL